MNGKWNTSSGNDDHPASSSSSSSTTESKIHSSGGSTRTDLQHESETAPGNNLQLTSRIHASEWNVSELPECGIGSLMINREKAQFDPRLVTPLYQKPMMMTDKTCFTHYPVLYGYDVNDMSTQAICAINGGKTWTQACFPNSVADWEAWRNNTGTLKPIESFHSPYFGLGSNRHHPDMHIHKSAGRLTLQFSIEEQHHSMLHTNANKDGIIEMTISKADIISQIKKQFKEFNADTHGAKYHLMIYDINVKNEHSNLLLPFDKILTTKSQESTTLDGTAKRVSWSEKVGNGMAGIVHNPIESEKNKTTFYNPILQGERLTNERQPLYIAPSGVNGAEYARWITMDWKLLFTKLKEYLADRKCASCNAYLIPLPDEGQINKDDEFHQFPFFTWFLLDNFQEIMDRTFKLKYKEVQLSDKVNQEHLSFGQVCTWSRLGEKTCLVNRFVFNQMLTEVQRKWSQDNMLMNIDDIKLSMWPLEGIKKGWERYGTKATALHSLAVNITNQAFYSAIVEISYEPIQTTRQDTEEYAADVAELTPVVRQPYDNTVKLFY